LTVGAGRGSVSPNKRVDGPSLNDLQKLCLWAERKRWKIRLTIRSSDKEFSSLEDLIVEERIGGRIIAAEPLYERDVVHAATEILRTLKLVA
jgi:hypothetical protein